MNSDKLCNNTLIYDANFANYIAYFAECHYLIRLCNIM